MQQPAFWLSVGKIIWIDLLLSGDNALVIALACRGFTEPAYQRPGTACFPRRSKERSRAPAIQPSSWNLSTFVRAAARPALLTIYASTARLAKQVNSCCN
jgi:hypothetical protein